MLIRQKIILSLIDQMGGQTSRRLLVKLAFLLGKEARIKNFYEFVPYHYGPFSFALYHELEMLGRNGYILFQPSEDRIQRFSDVVNPPLDFALENEIISFSEKHSTLSVEAVIESVYSDYPWFTINAKAVENRKEKRPKGKCAVYTVGYEGLQIDGFLNILLEAGIEQVIDVRHNPISRRYGFHKSTLSRLCQKLDIKYRHVPEVGIPSELRANLRQPSDYIPLFQNYEREILPAQPSAIKKIESWIETQPSVLVCMEANPDSCHRSHLAAQVANHTKLMIQDLRENTCKPYTPKQKF
jgi:uncharacterized protein (DUF488 family)